MKTTRIIDEDGKGFVRAFEEEDVEKVNPLDYFKEREVFKSMILDRDMLAARDPIKTAFLPEEFFRSRAEQKWTERQKAIQNTEIPLQFIELLETMKKSKQIALLKDASLTPMQLAALIFHAYSHHGFTLSQYRSEHLPKGTNQQELPKLIRVEGESTHKSGPTPLTAGQLRNIVTQRKVIVAKILDRDENWHCFFQTYKSVSGEERGEGPHLHYISDKWGVSRQEVVESIREGKYRATSVHINLRDYRTSSSGS